MIKHHDKKQLMGKTEFIVDLRFQIDKSPSQQGAMAASRYGNRSRKLRSTCSTSDTREAGMSETMKSQSWPQVMYFFYQGYNYLKFLEQHHQLGSVFKYMSLWGIFSFKPP